MRSAKPEPKRSLARRVALASALAAALGGAAAALTAGLVTTGLVREHDDVIVRDAAEKLAEETLEEFEDEEDEPLVRPLPTREAALRHGLDDVDMPGARASMREGARHVAGDASLPRIALDACEEVVRAGAPFFVCAVERDGFVFTLAVSAAREARERTLVMWAVLVGVFVGAVTAWLVSGRVARFALAPLERLRDTVRLVSPDDPRADVLLPEAAHVEVEELRAAIHELVARLGSSLVAAQSFATQAAHELRTPLATLGAELDLAVEVDAPLDARSLARVRGEVAGLTTLVERLLVLALPGKLEDGATEVVDLGDVVSDTLEVLPPDARARVFIACVDDALVRGDAALLRAMIGNALDNALKFAPGEVRVAIAKDARTCTIDVIDDGPGIAEDERARVFAPFYRTKGARASSTTGFGMGLALIAHVVDAHGGTVSIVPSTRGVHLRVVLPAFVSHASA